MTSIVPVLRPRDIGSVNWLGLWTMIDKEIKRFLKAYLQTIFAPVVSTLLFFAMFAFVLSGGPQHAGGASSLAFLVPGIVMMTMAQNAFMNTAGSLVLSKVQGNIVDVLMPPLSSFELTLSYMIGGIVRGLIVGAACIACLVFFVDIEVYNVFFILYYSIMGSMMLALIGTITGIWADKFDNMIAIHSFVVLPATMLSGTFFSIESLPESWRFICTANPFFYFIDGFRYGFIGSAEGNLWIGMAFVLAVNLGLLGATHHLFESGYKLKA
ncbi:MAG: ABC transporter permease [Bdellovibrionales bacterium]|jgi:ABC-2 type transport system permease protein